jgi:hypothetical protein
MNEAMRTFCSWCGVGLLIAGAAVALAEILTVVQGAPATLSPGAIWFKIHGNSLVGFQALIEKGPLPSLWLPIQYLLTLPTWLILVPPGLVLVLACRTRSRA